VRGADLSPNSISRSSDRSVARPYGILPHAHSAASSRSGPIAELRYDALQRQIWTGHAFASHAVTSQVKSATQTLLTGWGKPRGRTSAELPISSLHEHGTRLSIFDQRPARPGAQIATAPASAALLERSPGHKPSRAPGDVVAPGASRQPPGHAIGVGGIHRSCTEIGPGNANREPRNAGCKGCCTLLLRSSSAGMR
jgi:hypothetical protein